MYYSADCKKFFLYYDKIMATKELTQGSPLKLILIFMFPVFLGNIFQQIYSFVDALIVGRAIGIEALAAVGATMPLIFLLISFIYASTQGFTIITAQKFGAGEHHMLRKSMIASALLSGILTVILTLTFTPFSYMFLKLLRTPPDIINLSANYLVIMAAGIFATVFYNLAANIVRALGDSKTPLYFLIFSSFVNVFFDLLFIVKFNMGIKGAAYATVVSQAVSTVMCVAFMFWKFPILHIKKEDFNITYDFIYEHLRVGIPMGFQMSVLTIGIIALQYVLNSFGSVSVAAFTTAMRVDQLFSQTFVALGATMAVFTAQNFGAKKLSRIKEGAKAGVLISIVISVFSIIIILFFADDMISWFMTEINIEVLKLAEEYLFIVMVFFIFLGLLMVFRNILQGMGSVIAPLASGVAELIARTACAFIFGYYYGYTGICTATPAAWIAATIVLFVGYKLSLKKNIKLIKNKDV